MRLFVAIELAAELREELARAQNTLRKRFDDELRFSSPDQLHLTLKFFEDLPEERLPALSSALKTAAGLVAPFQMQLSGLGCFPERGPVRVVWAGVSAQDHLRNCWQQLEERCTECDFEHDERGLSPHVTLARARRPAREAVRKALADCKLKDLEQPVRELVLVQSVLGRGAPRHSILVHAPLGEGAA